MHTSLLNLALIRGRWRCRGGVCTCPSRPISLADEGWRVISQSMLREQTWTASIIIGIWLPSGKLNCWLSHTLLSDFPISVSGIWSGIKLCRYPQTRGWTSEILSIRLLICGAFEADRFGVVVVPNLLVACTLVVDLCERLRLWWPSTAVAVGTRDTFKCGVNPWWAFDWSDSGGRFGRVLLKGVLISGNLGLWLSCGPSCGGWAARLVCGWGLDWNWGRFWRGCRFWACWYCCCWYWPGSCDG